MRPAEPRKPAPAVAPRGPAEPLPPLPTPAVPLRHNPPRPIGADALRRLREAIQSGEYPSDSDVRAGVERLIRRDE